MANTAKLNLPLIDDNMVADVPRDVNAIANGIDAKAGAANGLATLGADGKVPAAQLSVSTPPDASTTRKGIVQLNDTVTSTSTTQAATANAVKQAYDEALAGKQLGVEQKANVVAALNSIGVTATTSETWAQLIPKISGVIRATGNATSADILAGKTASNQNGPLTGEMVNQGARILTPSSTSNVTIPEGYHNGSGYVISYTAGKQSANGSFAITEGNYRSPIPITNITFRPKTIIVYGVHNSGSGKFIAIYSEGNGFPSTINMMLMQGTSAEYSNIFTILNNGFNYISTSYNWFCYFVAFS